LYHISHDPAIVRFDPRPAPDPSSGAVGAMVWAIDDAHLPNYLLPRDCPRVTFCAQPDSDPADVLRLLGGSSAGRVVAIEAAWFRRVLTDPIYLYELPGDSFSVHDAGAGYHISREPVVPLSVRRIADVVDELIRHDVELRIMPSLWKLRDAVVASTLQFSLIRMRNAGPRPMPVLFL
jgi:hypothetical protein